MTYLNSSATFPIYAILKFMSTIHEEYFFLPRIKQEYAKQHLQHNIIETLNNTPRINIDIIYTRSLHGFTIYTKNYFITH